MVFGEYTSSSYHSFLFSSQVKSSSSTPPASYNTSTQSSPVPSGTQSSSTRPSSSTVNANHTSHTSHTAHTRPASSLRPVVITTRRPMCTTRTASTTPFRTSREISTQPTHLLTADTDELTTLAPLNHSSEMPVKQPAQPEGVEIEVDGVSSVTLSTRLALLIGLWVVIGLSVLVGLTVTIYLGLKYAGCPCRNRHNVVVSIFQIRAKKNIPINRIYNVMKF